MESRGAGSRDQYRDGTLLSHCVSIMDTSLFSVINWNSLLLCSINCVGGLRMPSKPELYTKSPFKGPIVHTAEWDHSLDLKGKTVAVIGTGASAVQVVPSIVDTVKSLEVFQRNSPWTVMRGQIAYPWIMKVIFRYVPFVMRAYRNVLFWTNELVHSTFREGSIFSKLGPLDHLIAVWRHTLGHPNRERMRELLVPTYAFGCKRIVRTDDFIPALCKPNVRVHTDRVDHVTEHGLVTTAGQTVAADVIVLATGFKVHDYFAPMRIFGRNGLDVFEMWKREHPKGYYGICANNIPNNFVIIGPGTGLGHNSIIFMIECQVNYVIQLIRHMITSKLGVCEVTEAAETAFGEYLKSNLKGTVWASPKCTSWYANAKGEVTALWPHSCFCYWTHTYRPNLKDFQFS
jgi:cation diffusion facilitator CzcD-associated flavoprotein CzcO